MSNIDAVIAAPHVRTPGEVDGFWSLYRSTGTASDRGNDVPVGHVAALMRQHGVATIFTRDRDFRRFDGIKPVDPFDS